MRALIVVAALVTLELCVSMDGQSLRTFGPDTLNLVRAIAVWSVSWCMIARLSLRAWQMGPLGSVLRIQEVPLSPHHVCVHDSLL